MNAPRTLSALIATALLATGTAKDAQNERNAVYADLVSAVRSGEFSIAAVCATLQARIAAAPVGLSSASASTRAERVVIAARNKLARAAAKDSGADSVRAFCRDFNQATSRTFTALHNAQTEACAATMPDATPAEVAAAAAELVAGPFHSLTFKKNVVGSVARSASEVYAEQVTAAAERTAPAPESVAAHDALAALVSKLEAFGIDPEALIAGTVAVKSAKVKAAKVKAA